MAIVAALCMTVIGAPGAAHAVSAEVPAATAGAEQAQRAAALQLLTFVPTAYRGSCIIYDFSGSTHLEPYAANITAALACRPTDGASRVWFLQFDNLDAMNQAFTGYSPNIKATDSGDCPGAGDWDRNSTHAGRWACYVSDDQHHATINWTDETNLILSTADRTDDDLAALFAWWGGANAAPLATPAVAGSSTPISPSAWRANAKKLVATFVPQSERKSCRVQPVTSNAMGEFLYSARLWIATSVTCGANGVDGVTYVKFRDDVTLDGTRPIDGMFAWVKDTIDESTPRVKLGVLKCEASGAWARSGHVVGEYACLYQATGTGHEIVTMEWTERDSNILALASRKDGRALPLMKFWATPAAGPLA